MKKLNRFAICSSLVASFCLGTAHSAWGLGFRNPDQDARATGQGEAFVAQADDASAIYYNPAGLTQLNGTVVTSGAYVSSPDIRFHGASGNEEMNSPSFTPHIYMASDLGTRKWRFGLGFNVPFGNAVDWGDHGSLRYTVTKSSLAVFSISPAAAYQVNDHLSLGAALNVYQGHTELHNDILLSPAPDGHFRFRGDGTAVGATVGLLWKITEQHTVGAVYRSPFTINFKGDAAIGNTPPFPFFPGNPGPSSAHSSIEFPQSAAIGYAFRPIKKLKLEADLEWTNWDTLNTVRLRSKNPTFDANTSPASNLPFNWKDSFYYEFGAQYQVNDRWVVRGGYIFSGNTVPNSTFSPTVPDSNRHVFSIGGGYSTARFGIDIAYQYSLSEDRTVNNSVFSAANGTWKSDGHALIITSSLKF